VATRRDIELRRRVQAELDWEPDLRNQEIALTVKHGAVTLWGAVSDTEQKRVARSVAQRVPGVEAVTDELQVRRDGQSSGRDSEIALVVRQQLKRHLTAQQDAVQATVAEGWVTLDGEIDVLEELLDAERCLRRIRGVRGITNRIHVGGFGKQGGKET
jgi:osmotically-inducible protein OsmY